MEKQAHINENTDIENLYLDGGGIFGFCLLGCLKNLEEKNILKNIKNILGCSVGALIGMLVALDYKVEEMITISYNIDLSKIINIKQNNFFNIMKTYGFDKGEKFNNIVKLLIRNKLGKDTLTFEELYQHNKKDLIIIGNNVSKRRHEIFNRKTQPNMEIWKAVRITCSIPLVFEPFIYQNNYYVDGGVSIYTTNYFKDNEKTIGFILEYGEAVYNKINSFEDYITNLCYTPLKSLRFSNFYSKNCIEIDTNKTDINTIDFSIDINTKMSLYNFGYLETEKQLYQIILNLIEIKNEKNKIKYVSIGTQTD